MEQETELLINAIKLKGLGKKQKYIFTADGRPEYFISNTHLEEFIKVNALPEHKFKLKLGPFKTDKSKNKLRSVYF